MGVNVTLGTDLGPSNDNYDMIREMKLAALLQKGVNEDPTAIGIMDALKIATINGAKALGKDKEFGNIEEGKKADLVFNGQILTINEEEVLEKAARHANKIREKLGLPESWISIQLTSFKCSLRGL